MSVVIQVDRISKQYRLGQIGGKRLVDDVNRWWARVRGKEDPLSKIGTTDHRPRTTEPKKVSRPPGGVSSQLSVVSSPSEAVSSQLSVVSSPSETMWALKDVSFEVRQGEVLGIIGRNGAGKSTLLKILSRVTAPTSGEIRVKGRIASLLEVGTGFHPELTGRENIFLNGAILGMTKAEIRSKFDEIVAFAEVEKFIDTPVKRYSSGMYVRLAFAVAAHLEPEILIVDEVLAVGDAEFQKKCLGKMKDVAGQGRTVLFVSHNMAAVQNLCSSAIVLSKGGMDYVGDTQNAVEFYLENKLLGNKSGAGGALNGIRPAWATPYITGARLMNSAGQLCSTFKLGADVFIEMDVTCPLGFPIRKPVMGVVVNHSRFGAVGGINMRMTGDDHYQGSFSHMKIACLLKSPPFLQGNYTIDLWLGDGSRDVDTLEGCLQLVIRESDVYASGKLPFKNLGVVFLNADWKLRGSPNAN